MSGQAVERLEIVIDAGAAAVLAAATAVVLFLLHAADAYSGSAAAIAFCSVFAALRSVEPEQCRFALPPFAALPIEAVEPDELVLSDADRLPPAAEALDDALLLDDVLAAIGPQSRVVRLFDPAAMPTPGQLQARIDRHLRAAESPETAPPDASQALYDALAELRRSLG